MYVRKIAQVNEIAQPKGARFFYGRKKRRFLHMLETIGIVLVVVALIAVGVFSWKWENSGSDDIKRTQTKDEHKEA